MADAKAQRRAIYEKSYGKGNPIIDELMADQESLAKDPFVSYRTEDGKVTRVRQSQLTSSVNDYLNANESAVQKAFRGVNTALYQGAKAAVQLPIIPGPIKFGLGQAMKMVPDPQRGLYQEGGGSLAGGSWEDIGQAFMREGHAIKRHATKGLVNGAMSYAQSKLGRYADPTARRFLGRGIFTDVAKAVAPHAIGWAANAAKKWLGRGLAPVSLDDITGGARTMKQAAKRAPQREPPPRRSEKDLAFEAMRNHAHAERHKLGVDLMYRRYDRGDPMAADDGAFGMHPPGAAAAAEPVREPVAHAGAGSKRRREDEPAAAMGGPPATTFWNHATRTRFAREAMAPVQLTEDAENEAHHIMQEHFNALQAVGRAPSREVFDRMFEQIREAGHRDYVLEALGLDPARHQHLHGGIPELDHRTDQLLAALHHEPPSAQAVADFAHDFAEDEEDFDGLARVGRPRDFVDTEDRDAPAEDQRLKYDPEWMDDIQDGMPDTTYLPGIQLDEDVRRRIPPPPPRTASPLTLDPASLRLHMHGRGLRRSNLSGGQVGTPPPPSEHSEVPPVPLGPPPMDMLALVQRYAQFVINWRDLEGPADQMPSFESYRDNADFFDEQIAAAEAQMAAEEAEAMAAWQAMQLPDGEENIRPPEAPMDEWYGVQGADPALPDAMGLYRGSGLIGAGLASGHIHPDELVGGRSWGEWAKDTFTLSNAATTAKAAAAAAALGLGAYATYQVKKGIDNAPQYAADAARWAGQQVANGVASGATAITDGVSNAAGAVMDAAAPVVDLASHAASDVSEGVQGLAEMDRNEYAPPTPAQERNWRWDEAADRNRDFTPSEDDRRTARTAAALAAGQAQRKFGHETLGTRKGYYGASDDTEFEAPAAAAPAPSSWWSFFDVPANVMNGMGVRGGQGFTAYKARMGRHKLQLKGSGFLSALELVGGVLEPETLRKRTMDRIRKLQLKKRGAHATGPPSTFGGSTEGGAEPDESHWETYTGAGDFSQGKIYEIRSEKGKVKYIGSTTESLKRRFARHKSMHKSWKAGNGPYVHSFKVLKFPDAAIRLFRRAAVKDKRALEAIEGAIQLKLKGKLVNRNVANRS